MKKYKFLLFFIFSNLSIIYAQTTYTSAMNGNWNTPQTWSPNGIPAASDNVIILGHTITVTANSTCTSITTKGANGGNSTLSINTGITLTVSGNIVVEPTNNYNNDSILQGFGKISVNNLQVGFATINNTFPTVTRTTTLFVNELAELKVNGKILSTTPVNTNPVAYNESRIRHKSGLIDIVGILDIPTVNPGPTLLGYRTDNDNQGDSKIIFRNATPIATNISGQRAPSFEGGTVEFLSTATTAYTLPQVIYKNLILNSNRTFTNNSGVSKIKEDGKLYLLKGILRASNAASSLGLDNNVEIIRTGGSIFDEANSRPRLTNATNQISITYDQHTSVINSGRELLAINSNTEITTAIKKITIQNTNGVNINTTYSTINSNAAQTEELVIKTSCSLAGSGSIKVTNLFDVHNSSTLTVTDGLIRLTSNSTNTARVASLPSNTIINGKVIVERYLANNRRQWRLLTAPVKGDTNNTIYENWQNNGYTDGVSGTEIWGPQGNWTESNPGNGLILVTNSSYNLRKFNNVSGTWSNVSNSYGEGLFTSSLNKGFLIFSTHPFNSGTDGNGGYFNDPISTTLKAMGNLIIGNVNYSNILTNQFYLIGNPYASPIDFQQILSDPANAGVDKIWFIDPLQGPLGGYVTWQDGVYSNGGTSFSGSTVFQSGQAFFVRAKTTTSTLTIKESHKSSNTTNTTLNRINSSSTNTPNSNTDLFRILLEKNINNVFTNMDGVVAKFYSGGTNNVDSSDAIKLSNPSETLSLFNTNNSISIEHRASIQDNDFLTLRLTQTSINTNYKLKLYTENFTYSGHAYLQDLFLGSTTEVPLDGSIFEYTFQVTNDVLSTGNRFKIIFQNQALNNTELTSNKFSIYPNPSNQQGNLSVLFNKTDDMDTYDYKIYNTLGQIVQFEDLNKQNSNATIPLNSSIIPGIYLLQLHNKNNNENFTKSLIIK